MKAKYLDEHSPEKLFWALLRRKHAKQISGLKFEQAQFIVALIPPDDYDDWMAWHEGLTEWKKLSHFKMLIKDAKGTPVYTPPIPPAHQDSPKDIQIDMRLSSRFLKEFKVEILSPTGKRYKTKTVNISTNGMLLAASVPNELGRNFPCRISIESGHTIDAFCSIVKNDTSRKRIKFMEISHPRILSSWLVDTNIR